MKVAPNEVKSSRDSSHATDSQLTQSGLLGLEGNSGSSRKPLSPSDTSIDESVKSAQHAGKEVRTLYRKRFLIFKRPFDNFWNNMVWIEHNKIQRK